MASIFEQGLYTIKCQITFIVLILLYAIPVYFDIYPSSDSYFLADSALPIGVWGMVLFTVVGIVTSLIHGTTCISQNTVYRGIGLKGKTTDNKNIDTTHGIIFPEGMPEDKRQLFRDGLSEVPAGWFSQSHIPISQFNNKLAQLNKDIGYSKII
jgi:hypothetical protein